MSRYNSFNNLDPRTICQPGMRGVHMHSWWGGDARCLYCNVPLAATVNHQRQWVASEYTWVIHEPATIWL